MPLAKLIAPFAAAEILVAADSPQRRDGELSVHCIWVAVRSEIRVNWLAILCIRG